MFDCGINEIVSDVVTSMEEENEKMIYKAVQSVGIDVDKKQLEKALFNAKSFYNDGYKDAKKQYEPKWIPVSERLPDEMGTYLVTLEYKEHGTGVTTLWFHGKEIGWDLRVADIVTAWMPIAEPYKESED